MKNPSGPVDFVWVGWPGTEIQPEHRPAVLEHAARYKAAPVFLSEQTADRFYHGFCNKTLWPLFHYFPGVTRYEEEYWKDYQRVNQMYAEALLNILRPGDVLWVHDYQLMLLPQLIRKEFPEMPIGFFLHIPFPSYEVFRQLPRAWRTELIEGVLGSSLVGFHTHDYTRDFLTSVLRTVGYEHQLGSISLRDRVVKVDTFPMGIDFERFSQAASTREVEAGAAELRRKCAGQKVIFSVDRLDYTKGLLDRLRGYDLFLKRHPEWHGKVTFVISVAPSRTGVESYRAMKREVEQLVGRIVGAYGNVYWTPLIYQYRNVSFEEIVALYRACDVALITPLRDGMNLVAKEFIASRPDKTGVLILSEMAGAAKEMGEALIINPYHTDECARTLNQALTMPVEDQIRRNQVLQERLRRYDVNRWAEDFVQSMLTSEKKDAAGGRHAPWQTPDLADAALPHVGAARAAARLRWHAGAFCGQPAFRASGCGVGQLDPVAGRRPGQRTGDHQRTFSRGSGRMVQRLAHRADRGARNVAPAKGPGLATPQTHHRRMEGPGASHSAVICGSFAWGPARGEGVLARLALPESGPGAGVAARAGTAG